MQEKAAYLDDVKVKNLVARSDWYSVPHLVARLDGYLVSHLVEGNETC